METIGNKAIHRISSYEEYKDIIAGYRKDCKCTNIYFLKEQILNMIRMKKLFYIIHNENFFLLKRESGCFRLYYYIVNDTAAKDFLVSVPIVVEYVYRNGADMRRKSDIQFLKQDGFVLGRRSCRMVLKSREFIYRALPNKGLNTIVSYAIKSDAKNIFHLLWEVFDPLYAYLPTMDDLSEIIDRNEILVAKVDGEVAGLLHFEFMRGSMHLWHLAVDEQYRGKGVGSLLLYEYHCNYQTTVNFFWVWTDMANEKAKNLYQQAGYCMDNRFADEYILLEEKKFESKKQTII